ncbi:MAG: hypothetical protein ACPGVB_02345 [Chitinophagales bacterium]
MQYNKIKADIIMTILNTSTEILSNVFQGLFGKKSTATTTMVSPQKEILPMSDEEYLAKAKKSADFNDMYNYSLMM